MFLSVQRSILTIPERPLSLGWLLFADWNANWTFRIHLYLFFYFDVSSLNKT